MSANLSDSARPWSQGRGHHICCPCIHQWFEAQVEKTPEAIALIYQGQQLTYQALNCRANQLAHCLQSQGIGPEDRVAISMERSLELIVAILGVLKAGATYVPLDPTYPHERRAYKLNDSRAKLILAQRHLMADLLPYTVPILNLDTDWETIATHPTSNPSVPIGSENLAYILYTSGSTGLPKGVMITHRGVVNHSAAIVAAFELETHDRVLQFSNIGFDILVEELFPTLVSGGALVLRPDDVISSTRRFFHFVQAQQITVLNLPTAFWHELVHGLSLLQDSIPISVRLVVVGGEKASRAVYEQWLQQVGSHPRWLNTYGPTEATVTSTLYDPLQSGLPPAPAPIPIGKPITNAEIYILDENMQPVPTGETGELYIGGPGLARGYLNQPERTAQQFIPHPFNPKDGARLYRTGDLARYLPDGNIEFVGRADFQVKMRGFRIELSEIEAHLEQHPDIHQSVVLMQEDAGNNKFLAAYVVLQAQQALDSKALQAFLATRLPDYMVPSLFMQLEALPLTPNGKVDRRALPLPDQAVTIDDRAVEHPQDGVEAQLVKIWQEVLGVSPIGVTDDFFDLGGHSLKVARLADRLEQVYHYRLPLTTLFQAPTIAQLAQVLRQEAASGAEPAIVPIRAAGDRLPLFLCEGISIYRPLIPYLRPDQPLYGLVTMTRDGVYGPINQVEAIAAHYIREIRQVQPQGPYQLAGLSFGGMVAFEMAQQLRAQGETVALLVLFDTVLPGAYKPLPLWEQCRFRLKKLQQQGIRYLLQSLARPLEQWVKQGRRFYRQYLSPLAHQPSETTTYFIRHEANDRAERAYIPRPYPGRVLIFRALDEDEGPVQVDPDLGWGHLALGGLEVIPIRGDHLGILQEPNVQVLGRTLSCYLS